MDQAQREINKKSHEKRGWQIMSRNYKEDLELVEGADKTLNVYRNEYTGNSGWWIEEVFVDVDTNYELGKIHPSDTDVEFLINAREIALYYMEQYKKVFKVASVLDTELCTVLNRMKYDKSLNQYSMGGDKYEALMDILIEAEETLGEDK